MTLTIPTTWSFPTDLPATSLGQSLPADTVNRISGNINQSGVNKVTKANQLIRGTGTRQTGVIDLPATPANHYLTSVALNRGIIWKAALIAAGNWVNNSDDDKLETWGAIKGRIGTLEAVTISTATTGFADRTGTWNWPWNTATGIAVLFSGQGGEGGYGGGGGGSGGRYDANRTYSFDGINTTIQWPNGANGAGGTGWFDGAGTAATTYVNISDGEYYLSLGGAGAGGGSGTPGGEGGVTTVAVSGTTYTTGVGGPGFPGGGGAGGSRDGGGPFYPGPVTGGTGTYWSIPAGGNYDPPDDNPDQGNIIPRTGRSFGVGTDVAAGGTGGMGRVNSGRTGVTPQNGAGGSAGGSGGLGGQTYLVQNLTGLAKGTTFTINLGAGGAGGAGGTGGGLGGGGHVSSTNLPVTPPTVPNGGQADNGTAGANGRAGAAGTAGFVIFYPVFS